MHSRKDKIKAFEDLLEVVETLRIKCPWDRKQTFESLRPNTIEETYELSDSILRMNYDHICKEAGDLLLHIIFYSVIGSEKQAFDIADVCQKETQKLIERHPHIYGDVKIKDENEVTQNWEQIKLKEKGGNKTVLAGVPQGLPSMIKAYRIQEKTANIGFDWQNKEEVWQKVKEEINEVETELKNETNKQKIAGEIGDLLFSIINVARKYGIDADTALEMTNRKFTNRFNRMEQQAKTQGQDLKDLTLEEMDHLWNQAKQQESQS